MGRAWLLGAAFVGSLAIGIACGSSDDGGGGKACTPGQSIACVGAGGCSGGQICNQSGTGYGECACGSGGGDAGNSDSGSGADAEADAGSFAPTDVAGLVLWFSADDVVVGDGGAVASWPDQSGRGHDVIAGAKTPVVDHAAIGGRDALKFSGAQTLTHAALETDFGWGTDDFVVEMVVKFDSLTHDVLFALEESASDAFSVQVDTGTLEYFWSGDSQTATFSTGAHVVAFRRTGASTAELRVDGTVTPIPVAGTDTLTPSASIFVGGVDPLYTIGDIAEVVVAHGPSDGDVTKLEAYLKSKYGL